MTKKEERARIAEAVKSPDFEQACVNDGFTICNSAEEGKSKKKANV